MKNILFLFGMLCSLTSFAQNKPVIPPAEVQSAFEKQFPKMKPNWTSEYKGDDGTDIRYEATFSDGTDKMAAYDKIGNLKTVEELIQISQLPLSAVHYLRSHTYEQNILEISKVTDNIKVVTYEVGLKKDGKFLDLIFDAQGDFLQSVAKDN